MKAFVRRQSGGDVTVTQRGAFSRMVVAPAMVLRNLGTAASFLSRIRYAVRPAFNYGLTRRSLRFFFLAARVPHLSGRRS